MANLNPASAENPKGKPARPKMSARMTSAMSIRSTHSLKESKSTSSLFSQSWGMTWRKALVSAPRAVPDAVLRFTSPVGPHPMVLKIPSRDKSRKIPLYVFVPTSITSRSRGFSKSKPQPDPIKSPLLLDFHGGGFILGSCQEQAPFCAKLARDLNCIAISVDYRLGPYDKFPTAYHDAEDVLNAVLHPEKPGYKEIRKVINHELRSDHRPPIDFDTTRIALSGFSSGGSLALNLAMSIPAQKNDEHVELNIEQEWSSPFPSSYNHPIPALLYYPALDTRLLPHERPLVPGMEAPKSFWSSLNLEAELMPTYLPKWLTVHPRASPGLVSTRLEDKVLHPRLKALLILPEMDTLAASNELWVKRMNEEGRGEDLEVERVKGMLHGWTQFPDPFLDENARKLKNETFEKTVVYVKKIWGEASKTAATTGDQAGPSTIKPEDSRDGYVDFEGKQKYTAGAEQEWKKKAEEKTST